MTHPLKPSQLAATPVALDGDEDEDDAPGAWLTLRDTPDSLADSKARASEQDAGLPASEPGTAPEALVREPMIQRPLTGAEFAAAAAARMRKRLIFRENQKQARDNVVRTVPATRAGLMGLRRPDIRAKLKTRTWDAPICNAMSRESGRRCRQMAVRGSDRCCNHYGASRAPRSEAAVKRYERGDLRDWYSAIDPRDKDGVSVLSSYWRRVYRKRALRIVQERPDVAALVERVFGVEWIDPYARRWDNAGPCLDVLLAARWMIDTEDDRPWLAEKINWGATEWDVFLEAAIKHSTEQINLDRLDERAARVLAARRRRALVDKAKR